MNEVISNSTCLIGLDRIDRLDILPQLFSGVIVPPVVKEETGMTFDWLQVQQIADSSVARALRLKIDAGEADAIALALTFPHLSIILDDQKARRVAKHLGLHVIGTVGVILNAKQRGIVSKVKPILQALTQCDFRISDSLVNEALKIAGESAEMII